ncbi:MAG: methylmalonyl Co-A mutase-associated GTPase MeaB [Longilinea sp.]|nr:methylmalonyl Co-A mutase-associated GTPase MeaB [Longilinea sp.]
MNSFEAVRAGDRLALARLLTQVENQTPTGRQALNDLFPYTGRAHLVGVTGSPGTGKSSLVNRLAYAYRHPPQGQLPRRVAVVAVDPSSPFTGGAVLGDRVRMRDLTGDPGVFIRSMAARGALGGLARSTADVVQVLDAAGFELILIETVGAGQSEVDIARLAHTTLVVESPGMGDDIQAIKAGILEIADVLVVNKADRPGVDHTERALRAMLELAHPARRQFAGHHGAAMDATATVDEAQAEELWMPPVLRLIATTGVGVAELAQAVDQHADYLRRSGEWKRRESARLQAELEMLIQATLMQRWRQTLPDGLYDDVFAQLAARRLSPYEALDRLIQQ